MTCLPSTLRARRRKIATHIFADGSEFLDTTMVGVSRQAKPALEEERNREFVAFTQFQQRASYSSNGTPEASQLTEVRLYRCLPERML